MNLSEASLAIVPIVEAAGVFACLGLRLPVQNVLGVMLVFFGLSAAGHWLGWNQVMGLSTGRLGIFAGFILATEALLAREAVRKLLWRQKETANFGWRILLVAPLLFLPQQMLKIAILHQSGSTKTFLLTLGAAALSGLGAVVAATPFIINKMPRTVEASRIPLLLWILATGTYAAVLAEKLR